MSRNPHRTEAPETLGGLSDRGQRLLKVLVERYIRDGQPVGSRTLSRDLHQELSAASIRNVMADLEEMGLVASPHTSAGRVPTVRGYRLFVDSLLTIKPLHEGELNSLKSQLLPGGDRQLVLKTASSLLSEITAMAGLVTLPRREQVALRHIEFLPLSNNRVLVILVINEQEVQNRIIHPSRQYSESELQQASNYLNREFAGKSMDEVRRVLLREMQEAREEMNQLMAAAIEMASQVFTEEVPDSAEEDYVLAGQTNLMGYAEMADVGKLRRLFDAFTRKQDILHLLDHSLGAEGIQIFIGEESGYSVLDECSVVTSPYTCEGQVVGVLGVIGPTRMAYDRVIPIVDVTARLLSAALNQAH